MSRVSQDPCYGELKGQLIELTGLAYYVDRDKQLTELISERLERLALPNCTAYAAFLAEGAAGHAEMEFLIAQLTIGETYFFRDADQFAAIRDIVIPDILERNKASRQIRIWSAGCATGAEPYSLAILLEREFADQIAGWQITIHATDLNRSYLTQAAAGEFRSWALRATSEEIKRGCFSNVGSIWTIHPRYKQWISFHQVNLVESDAATPLAAGTKFDLILCRNVMIYFSTDATRRLIRKFHGSLGDGGWLVVAAPEYSVEKYAAFRTVDAPGARLYQKASASRLLREVPPVAGAKALSKTPALVLAHPPAPARPDPVDISGLRLLADRGEWKSAADYSQQLLTQDRLNSAIHFYQALIFENLGSVEESERSLRQAIYLDRNFALAHYHLGLLLSKRDRQGREAERSFENVLQVLASLADDATVTAGPEVTVVELKELARMHLESSSVA